MAEKGPQGAGGVCPGGGPLQGPPCLKGGPWGGRGPNGGGPCAGLPGRYISCPGLPGRYMSCPGLTGRYMLVFKRAFKLLHRRVNTPKGNDF